MNKQTNNFQYLKFCLFLIICTFSTLYLNAESILFSADSMSGKSSDTDDRTKLTGNAIVTTDSMEIQGDEIEIYGKDYRFIHAEGNISGKNTKTKIEFSCSTLDYDKQTRTVILQDNVTMTDTENAVKASAQKIEYKQDSDVAVLQVNVELEQKKNVCTCEFAIYQKKAQLLDMSGNPVIQKGDDKFSAQSITFDLNTEAITMNGKVAGEIKSNDKDSKDDNITTTDTDQSESSLDKTPDTAKQPTVQASDNKLQNTEMESNTNE